MPVYKTIARIITAVTVVIALPATADTRIEYVDENTGETQTVITIKDGQARMENVDDTGYTLFDASAATLTTVDPEERTFTVMDEASMQALSSEVDSAMSQMRAELEKMPPEQRAMMKKMMGGMADFGKSMLETSVKRTGNTMNKGGYECEQVFFSVGSVASTELCVVDAGELGMPDEDQATMNTMYAQMKAMAEKMASTFGVDMAPDMEALGGIPVYTRGDDEDFGEVIKDITHDGIDAALFTIPDGYREEKMDVEG